VSAGITQPLSLIPAHAPDLNPLASFGPTCGYHVPLVFAGCYVPLLGVGLSRRYLRNLCVGAWTLTPRRLFGAITRFFPKSLGLTRVLRGSARSDVAIIQLQRRTQFRGCSQFVMFRLPHLLDPQVVPTARNTSWAAEPFTPRNGLEVTPKNCGIATCLNRAIGTTGLSPVRLRPCRPLPRTVRTGPYTAPHARLIHWRSSNQCGNCLSERIACPISPINQPTGYAFDNAKV